jgi:hypothetical protein
LFACGVGRCRWRDQSHQRNARCFIPVKPTLALSMGKQSQQRRGDAAPPLTKNASRGGNVCTDKASLCHRIGSGSLMLRRRRAASVTDELKD